MKSRKKRQNQTKMKSRKKRQKNDVRLWKAKTRSMREMTKTAKVPNQDRGLVVRTKRSLDQKVEALKKSLVGMINRSLVRKVVRIIRSLARNVARIKKSLIRKMARIKKSLFRNLERMQKAP